MMSHMDKLKEEEAQLSENVRCIRKFYSVMYEAGRGWSPHMGTHLSLAEISYRQAAGVKIDSAETIAAIREASGAKSADIVDWVNSDMLVVSFEEHKLAGAVINAALAQNIALQLGNVFRPQFKGGETYSRDLAEAKVIDHVIARRDMLNDDPVGTTDFDAFLKLRKQVVYMIICGTFQNYSYLCAEPCAWSSAKGKKFAQFARTCFARHDLPGSRKEQPCRRRDMRALGKQLGMTINIGCEATDCTAAGKHDEEFGKVTISGISVLPGSTIVVKKCTKKRAAPSADIVQRKEAKVDTE